METRVIEYPRSGGLEYHHNSPLIGEIPTNEYSHFHRSIDQLRTLNHFQNVLVPANSSSTATIVQAEGTAIIYGEIKINDGQTLKILRKNYANGIDDNVDEHDTLKLSANIPDQHQEDIKVNDKKDNKYSTNNFHLIQSPSQTLPMSPQTQHLQYNSIQTSSLQQQSQSYNTSIISSPVSSSTVQSVTTNNPNAISSSVNGHLKNTKVGMKIESILCDYHVIL